MEINTIFTLIWIVVGIVYCIAKCILVDYVLGVKYWAFWALVTIILDVFTFNYVDYKIDWIVPFYYAIQCFLLSRLAIYQHKNKKYDRKSSTM